MIKLIERDPRYRINCKSSLKLKPLNIPSSSSNITLTEKEISKAKDRIKYHGKEDLNDRK